MGRKSYYNKLRDFANNNDLWDKDAEERLQRESDEINRRDAESLEKIASLNQSTIEGGSAISDEDSLFDRYKKYRDKGNTVLGSVANALDPTGDKALLTTEQKTAYANNNLSGLSDENINTLREFNKANQGADVTEWLDNITSSLGETPTVKTQDQYEREQNQKKEAEQKKQQLMNDLNIDEDTFSKYVAAVNYLDNQEQRKKIEEEAQNNNDVVTNAASMIASPSRAIGDVLGVINQRFNPYRDEAYDIDFNSGVFGLNQFDKATIEKTTQDIQDNVDSDLAKEWLPVLYQGAKSGIESGIKRAAYGGGNMGAAGAIISGGIEGYTNEREEAQERGLSRGQAIMLSAGAGGAEALWEIAPQANLGKVGKSGLKNIVKDVIKQSAMEGVEEVETDLTNYILDDLVTGDNSKFNKEVENYVNNGMSEEEATKQAIFDRGIDLAQSFVGGAVGGIGLGGGASFVNYAIENNNSKVLDNHYDKVAEAISDNIDDYKSEDAYNKAMEVKERALEYASLDKVSGEDRTQLLRDIYDLDSTMKGTIEIEDVKNNNFTDVYNSIIDNPQLYANEEAYNKAMQIKSRAEELSQQDKVSNKDKKNLINDIEEVNNSITMPTVVDVVSNNLNNAIREETNPYTTIGNVSVLKNELTPQEVAKSMTQAKNVDEFVEAYRESQASQNEEARKTGEEYFATLRGKHDYIYDETDNEGNIINQNVSMVDTVLNNSMSADDIYDVARRGGAEFVQDQATTPKQLKALEQGVAEFKQTQQERNNRIAKLQEQKVEKKTVNVVNNISESNLNNMTFDNEGNVVSGSEVVIPKSKLNKGNARMFINNVVNQPTLSAKQLYVKGYNGEVALGSYQTAFNSAYTAGARGYSLKNWLTDNKHALMIKQMGEDFLTDVYNEGAKEQTSDTKKRATKVKKNGKVRVVKVDTNGKTTEVDNKEVKKQAIYKTAEKLAKKLNIDIDLTEDEVKVNGVNQNGSFDAATASMLLNINGKEYRTLFHEAIGEYLEAYNPQDMRDIQNAILTYMQDTYGEKYVDDRINDYLSTYKRAKGDVSYREASNEYVNDLIFSLFANDKGADDFITWASGDRTLLQKIKDFIDGLIEQIKNISDKGLQNMAEANAQKLRQQIFDALDNAEGVEETTETKDNQYSLAIEDKSESNPLEVPYVELSSSSDLSQKEKLEFNTNGQRLTKEEKEFYKDETDELIVNGALEVLYFGTPEADITEFDVDTGEDGISTYLTNNRTLAETYAGSDFLVDPYDQQGQVNTFEDLLEKFAESDLEPRYKDYKYQLVDTSEPEEYAYYEAPTISELLDDYYADMGVTEKDGGVYELYAHITNPLIIDANKNVWDELSWESPDGEMFDNTFDISEYAKDEGYDGVIFKNMHDFGGAAAHQPYTAKVVVVFNSNQVKSVDNPNPTNSDDIRYSLDVEEQAKKHFGTTDNFKTAGYMLQDGTLLDFSGAHWLEGESQEYINNWKKNNDIRQVDHEDIYEVMEASGDNRKQFIDRGNIRLNPEAPGFNLSSKVEPTKEQYQKLKEFIREIKRNPYYEASRFYVDIEEDRPNKIFYANNLNEDRIINDIKKYYKTGELPQENSLNDFRYSLDVDIEGNKLSEAQKEYFKDSKVVDEDGRLKVVYHGTPNGDFTVFKYPLSYFTTDKEYADVYQDTSASSSGIQKEKTNPKTFKGYLNITKPFDINNAEDRRIFIDEYVKGGYALGINPYISNAEIEEQIKNGIDWTEAENLFDFIEENDLDYDGLILNEGGNFDEEGNVRQRGKSYVAFNSNQFKNIDNENPTDSEDIRYSLDVPTTHSLDTYSPFIDENGEAWYGDEKNDLSKQTKNVFEGILKSVTKSLNYKISQDDIKAIAHKVVSDYNSDITEDMVSAQLKIIFDMLNEGYDVQEITDALLNLAEDVVMNSKAIDPVDQELYDKIADVFKRNRFKLNDNQRKEVNGIKGWSDFFGGISFAISGKESAAPYLDNVYSEIAEELRKIGVDIDEYAADTDQPLILKDVVENYHPQMKYNTFEGADITDVALTTAMDVMRMYYDKAVINTAKDNEVIKKAKADLKKQVAEYKKKIGEQYQKEVKELKKQLKEKDEANAMLRGLYTDEFKKAQQGEEYQGANKELQGENKRLAGEIDRLNKRAERMAKNGRNSVMRYKERQEKSHQMDMIKKAGNELYRMLENPTKKKFIPEIMKKPVLEMLDAIDFVSHRAKEDSYSTQMWKAKMERVKTLLNDINDEEKIKNYGRTNEQRNVLRYLAINSENVVKGMLEDFLNNADDSKIAISRLNAEDLKRLNKFVTALKQSINKANQTFANGMYTTIDEMSENALAEMYNLTPLKALQGTAKKTLHDFLNVSQLEPVSYFTELGKTSGSLFREFVDGLNTKLNRIFDSEKAFDKKKKELDVTSKMIKEWSNNINTFKLSDGTLELTDTQIMYMYLLNIREQELYKNSNGTQGLHMIFGGVVATENKKNKKRQTTPVHLKPSEIEKITSQLTNKQKAIADYMMHYMSNECSKWGNNITRQKYGLDLYTEDKYVPIKSFSDYNQTNVGNVNQNATIYSLQNVSFSKELTQGANNAVMISDVFDVFTEHVSEMATYEGFVLPINDAMRFYNHDHVEMKDTQIEGIEGVHRTDASVKNAINYVMGEKGKQYFTRFLEDVNGSGKTYNDLQGIAKMFSNNKAQAVLANLRVVIQQPTAYLRALDVIENKYLAKSAALAPATLIKYMNKSKQNNPLAMLKSKGYYETNIGQSWNSIITGKQSARDKINDIAGTPAGIADDITWGMLYHAAELKVDDTTNLEKDSKEYIEKVNEIFDEIIIKTQVIDTVLTKSQVMRNKDGMSMLATAFMAEPTKSYNMLHRSWWEGKQTKNWKPLFKTSLIFLYTQLFVSIAQSIIDAWRDDEEDKPYLDRFLNAWLGIDDFKKAENLNDFAKAAAGSNLIDDVNPFNLLPIIKDISSAIQGFDNNNMSTAAIYNVVEAIQEVVKYASGNSTKTPYGLTYKVAQALSTVSGVPVASAMREVKDIYNNVNDLWGGENITRNEVSTSSKEKSKNEDSFKVIDEGGDITGEWTRRKQEFIETYMKDEGLTQEEATKKAQSTLGGYITAEYKPRLKELYSTDMTEAANLKNRLIQAYTAIGKTNKKANTDIDKWLK